MHDNYEYRPTNVGYDEYVVQKGDTLYTIAKKYGITTNEIIDFNMLTNNTIYPNQVLLIPIPSPQAAYFDEYIIKPEDTIAKIAQKLDTDPATLGTYNDFAKLYLVSGQKLMIPKSTRTYIVKSSDTVDKIVSNSGRSCLELLELNKSNWLKEGSKINI